jgi:hypothetical protein
MRSFLCPLLAADASDLNLPSIGIAELSGTQTVTRRITNVGPSEVYRLAIEAPAGIRVRVSVIAPPGSWDPSTGALTLQSGDSVTYRATFSTLPNATLGAWAFGAITWTSPGHRVRSPVAIRPVP